MDNDKLSHSISYPKHVRPSLLALYFYPYTKKKKIEESSTFGQGHADF